MPLSPERIASRRFARGHWIFLNLEEEEMNDSSAKHVCTAFNGGRVRDDLGERQAQCPEHGPYTSTGVRYFGSREVWTRCPDCEEARLAAERKERAAQHASRETARLQAMLGEARIPARFVGRTFDTFVADTTEKLHALTVAREFAESFDEQLRDGSSLVFLGKPGTGKSHLAAAILQAIMPEHCGLYVTCMQVVRAVRNAWRKDSERSESDVMAEFARVPLLVIDEVGAQYGTEGEQMVLFEVLDRRYLDMKPTILLTNQNMPGLKQFLGERVHDRLIEIARAVVFDWESYRKQARKEAA